MYLSHYSMVYLYIMPRCIRRSVYVKLSCLILLLSVPMGAVLAADGNEPELIEAPAYVPEVLTFFNRELQAIMSFTTGSYRPAEDLYKFAWFSSVVSGFDVSQTDSSDLNFLGGFHFRAGPFRLPFFAAVVTEVIEQKPGFAGRDFYSSYLGFFGGSGLIYDNPYFSVGTFAGYYDKKDYVKCDSVKLAENEQGSFSFTVIPVLRTEELLYLNILRDIIVRLNATHLGMNDIASNFRFRSFSLFGADFDLSLYYLRESYVSIAKNNIYGARLCAGFANSNLYHDFFVRLSLEGGYRNFFANQYDRYIFYEDTLFVKTEIDLIWETRRYSSGVKLDIAYDGQSGVKIGAYMVLRAGKGSPFNGICGGEIGRRFSFGTKVFMELN